MALKLEITEVLRKLGDATQTTIFTSLKESGQDVTKKEVKSALDKGLSKTWSKKGSRYSLIEEEGDNEDNEDNEEEEVNDKNKKKRKKPASNSKKKKKPTKKPKKEEDDTKDEEKGDDDDDEEEDDLTPWRRKPKKSDKAKKLRKGDAKVTHVIAYANCNEAQIVWRTGGRINELRGFAVYRKRQEDKTEQILHSYVGFVGGEEVEGGTHKPTNEWPIQKFMWSDLFARPWTLPVATVQYKVVPVVSDGKKLVEDDDGASDWSQEVVVTGNQPAKGGITGFFNRGVIATQHVSRRLKVEGGTLNSHISSADEKNDLRDFLGGELRLALHRLLDDTIKNKGRHVYGALYELNHEELILRLIKLGKRAHIVLANGSYKGKNDPNSKVRARLKKAKCDISDRLLTGTRLGHNKFVVFTDDDNKPVKVWTGSTNWTDGGVCTQVNNGLLIEDAAVAKKFKEQHDLLVEAGSTNGEKVPKLLDSNDKVFEYKKLQLAAWFTPTRDTVDLEYATQLIKNAKTGILFLFFLPGGVHTLLNEILDLGDEKPDLHIHGVVNQDLKRYGLDLVHRGRVDSADPAVLLPAVLPKDKSGKLKEFWKEAEKKGNGFVAVHSKVIVVDPFGSESVVMTGSHNMGPKASEKNDENLVIIRNHPTLAAAYAVNIMGVYDQYRWRYKMTVDKAAKVWQGLEDNDTWQDDYIDLNHEKSKEIDFWLPEQEE